MEIEFKTSKLHKECCSKKEATRVWGPDNGSRLMRRLDDLRAASTLAAMRNLPGRCHELIGDKKGQLSLDVKHPLRLMFEPIGEGNHKPEGGLDWIKVTAVRILGIEDTHD